MAGDALSGENEDGAHVVARGLTRRFGSRVALDALDLEIERGSAFGLLGANGAGKTTFIRLVTGALLPSEGAIRVAGLDPTTERRDVQRRIGFVAESSRIYPELRVDAFLRFMAGLRGLAGGAAKEAVERTLGLFSLDEHRRRLIGNLSKGLCQRVSLAQAFLHEPELLVVDEPTSGLDPLQQAEVRDLLAAVRGRCTVLLCTHDLAEARELTSRVAVLHRGRLVAEGAPDALLVGRDALALFRGSAPGSEGAGEGAQA